MQFMGAEMSDQKIHDILIIGFEDNKMKIVVDGKQHEFLLEVISPKLGKASPQQLAKYEISPSGYGIHWPEIDEDISIDGLIGEKNKIERGPNHQRRAV